MGETWGGLVSLQRSAFGVLPRAPAGALARGASGRPCAAAWENEWYKTLTAATSS